MDVTETEFAGVDCIYVAPDMDRLLAFVNMVTNIWFQ